MKKDIEEILDCITENISQIAEILDKDDSSKVIKNIDDFIFRLKIDGLHDEKLEKFINDYLKFYNNGG